MVERVSFLRVVFRLIKSFGCVFKEVLVVVIFL